MEGRKIVISGAGRGLGRALAIVAASQGATPILLGRSHSALQEVSETIKSDNGATAYPIICDLSNPTSMAQATKEIAESHPDIDILVNNGAHFTEGSFDKQTDDQIASIVGSAVTGTMILTRQLLPLLKQRPRADIHNIVSMSGLQYARLTGASLPFRAAKAAQDGFTQGLVEELKGTSVRVTSVYPGLIEDLSPASAEWEKQRGPDEGMTNKNVVDTIIYALSAPPERVITLYRYRANSLRLPDLIGREYRYPEETSLIASEGCTTGRKLIVVDVICSGSCYCDRGH